MTRPLFRFDPGWLFIAAGLAVCAAGLILPAQYDLQSLQTQLQLLQAEETQANARLKAHSDFIDQVDRAEPGLIRRLAATQLNLMPEGETPVLLASAPPSPVTHWIESGVKLDLRPPLPPTDSILSRLANGPHRLWMFAMGAMSVFIGLLLAPISLRNTQQNAQSMEDAIATQELDQRELILAETASAIDVERQVPESNQLAAVDAVATMAAEKSILPVAAAAEVEAENLSAVEQKELATLAAIETASDLPSDTLTDEQFASVLEKVASDLAALDLHAQEIYEANAAAIDALQSNLNDDQSDAEDNIPDTPEIETDASYLIEPKNRLTSDEA
jgi:hypothetical protein